MTTNFWKNKIS